MSHEVETMAFAHQVPWHGLGVNVPADITTDDMLVAAGLDWEVERLPITVQGSDTVIPNKLAVRRATDGMVYDVVSPRWKPVQNREILDFFREWTIAGHATIETAGSLRKGRQVWALANLGTGFVLPGGDAVKGYVLLVGSHESGKSTIVRTTPVRVVCANTLAMALSSGKSEVRWTHARDFDADVAREQLAVSREDISEFGRNAELLMSLNMTRDDAVRVLAPVYQSQAEVQDLVKDETLWCPIVRNIMWADSKAPGAAPGTGWGLLNGVTYAADHMSDTRTPDGRFYAAQLGHQAARKQEVLDTLLEMV